MALHTPPFSPTHSSLSPCIYIHTASSYTSILQKGGGAEQPKRERVNKYLRPAGNVDTMRPKWRKRQTSFLSINQMFIFIWKTFFPCEGIFLWFIIFSGKTTAECASKWFCVCWWLLFLVPIPPRPLLHSLFTCLRQIPSRSSSQVGPHQRHLWATTPRRRGAAYYIASSWAMLLLLFFFLLLCDRSLVK